jgi:hypothetical protein
LVNSKKTLVAVVLLLALGLVSLAACGDTATPSTVVTATIASNGAAPAPTVAATITTSAATTTTTSANTTTTLAVTATTTSSVSAVTTQAAATNQKLDVPAIPGLSEIPLSPDELTGINQSMKMFPAIASLNTSLKLYGSDSDVNTAISSIDKSLTSTGYTFNGYAGQTKLTAMGGGAFGLYTKAGSPDLFLSIYDSGTALQFASSFGGTPWAGYSDYINQLKSKKTIVTIYGGQGFSQAFNGGAYGFGSAPTPSK